MEHELKPCPHCGRDAKVYIRESNGHEFFAGCKNLKCPTYTPYVASESEAADMWNKGKLCVATATNADIDNLEEMASRSLRLRVVWGDLTGDWAHCLDRSVLETDFKCKIPLKRVATAENFEDAAYIAAANPATILALIHELRACRAKLAEYEQ